MTQLNECEPSTTLSEEKVREWLESASCAMTSALDEYCPAEFTLLAKGYLQLVSTKRGFNPFGTGLSDPVFQGSTVPVVPWVSDREACWPHSYETDTANQILHCVDCGMSFPSEESLTNTGVSEAVLKAAQNILDAAIIYEDEALLEDAKIILVALLPTDTGRE